MSKIDHQIMQKRKDFYLVHKKKGVPVNVAGLLYTEEDSFSGWVNNSKVKNLTLTKSKFSEKDINSDVFNIWILMS